MILDATTGTLSGPQHPQVPPAGKRVPAHLRPGSS
jgi:hypothetical protein